jgi:AcrR family transcriptional regulator
MVMATFCHCLSWWKREEKIIDASVRVFSRYGVKRTTMNDVALEVGIARQTLYTVYSSKDEVLRATIRLFTDRSLANIEAATAAAASLRDKLDVVFAQMVIKPF